MTANMIKGKGFGGALRYNLEKVDKGVAEILDSSFVYVTQKAIMKEMQMVKMLRPNLQKHFYHTSINFPPSENPSSEKMREIGREYLEESGFNQHQFIMFRHHDADHPHLHILVSRIGYDGSVLSDSNDFAKCEIILRRLEKRHNLAEVVSSRNAQKRAVTKNELEMGKRTGIPSNKMRMQSIIKEALNSSKKPSCIDFVQRLQSKGVNVLFNQASTGYVSGISYGLDGFMITGSKLGNAYKWTTLKNTVDYEQERDGATIQAANDRTRSLKFESTGGTSNSERSSESIQPDGSQNRKVLAIDKQNSNGHTKRLGKARTYKRAIRSTKQGDGSSDDLFSKKPEESVFGTLLHSDPGRVDGRVGDEYYLDYNGLKRKRRKKQGRSL